MKFAIFCLRVCVWLCLIPSNRQIAQLVHGLHNLKIAQLFSFSEIIHRWHAHFDMVALSADHHVVLRHLKIILISIWRLTKSYMYI